MPKPFDSEQIDTLCAAIAHRRSMGIARVHADQPVDSALIEKALQAADWAPSHGETEPWRFTVYTGDSRSALGDAFAEAYRLDAGEDGFKQAAFEANRARALGAPVWKIRRTDLARLTEPAEATAGRPRREGSERFRGFRPVMTGQKPHKSLLPSLKGGVGGRSFS